MIIAVISVGLAHPKNFGGIMQYYCELCDTYKLAERRKDNIYVCKDCDKKHPIKNNNE